MANSTSFLKKGLETVISMKEVMSWTGLIFLAFVCLVLRGIVRGIFSTVELYAVGGAWKVSSPS